MKISEILEFSDDISDHSKYFAKIKNTIIIQISLTFIAKFEWWAIACDTNISKKSVHTQSHKPRFDFAYRYGGGGGWRFAVSLSVCHQYYI